MRDLPRQASSRRQDGDLCNLSLAAAGDGTACRSDRLFAERCEDHPRAGPAIDERHRRRQRACSITNDCPPAVENVTRAVARPERNVTDDGSTAARSLLVNTAVPA